MTQIENVLASTFTMPNFQVKLVQLKKQYECDQSSLSSGWECNPSLSLQ